MTLLKWYDAETNEMVIEAEDNLPLECEPECPKCGKSASFWEGVVDQDQQGNDIEGCHFVCHNCRINTKTQYL